MRLKFCGGCTLLATGVAVYTWALIAYWQTDTCGQKLVYANLAALAILAWHWFDWGQLLFHWVSFAKHVRQTERTTCLTPLDRDRWRRIGFRCLLSLVVALTGIALLARASTFQSETPTIECVQRNETATCQPCRAFPDASRMATSDYAMMCITVVSTVLFAIIPTVIDLLLLVIACWTWLLGPRPPFHGGAERDWNVDVEMAETT